MCYTVIKHSWHLRTLEKWRQHLPVARIFYIFSLMFSNACHVLSQCNTWPRLLYLFNKVTFYTNPVITLCSCNSRNYLCLPMERTLSDTPLPSTPLEISIPSVGEALIWYFLELYIAKCLNYNFLNYVFKFLNYISML